MISGLSGNSNEPDPIEGFDLRELASSEAIRIPKNPLLRIIGQDHSVKLAEIAVRQHRHLLLVGPSGIGKSMLAHAMAVLLPHPNEGVSVVHNPKNPERPLTETFSKESIDQRQSLIQLSEGNLISPQQLPQNIAEKMGFLCITCGSYSAPHQTSCSTCGELKRTNSLIQSPFMDLLKRYNGKFPFSSTMVPFTCIDKEGKEKTLIYERVDVDPYGLSVRVLSQEALNAISQKEEHRSAVTLIDLDRNPFIQATGVSEAELLGDIRHDPYGGHSTLGTLPYKRVIAGAIHEAHQGVLYIDEIAALGHLQRCLLTAMQINHYPICGRNPQSSGAAVRLDNVPCSFILVAACNIRDLEQLLPPLRNRIQGSGYEILLNTSIPDTPYNQCKLAQFVAQEIRIDQKIPHASLAAIKEIIKFARICALMFDNQENALTLRLRKLGGLIRLAGYVAFFDDAELIERSHIKEAERMARPIEEQLLFKYGTIEDALNSDAPYLSHVLKDSKLTYLNEYKDPKKSFIS